MLNSLLSGAIAMSALVISLFFIRFWRSTHDRLFIFFALSFFLEAVNRTLLGLSALATEASPQCYVIRLVAYLLILYAIYDKNQRQRMK